MIQQTGFGPHLQPASSEAANWLVAQRYGKKIAGWGIPLGGHWFGTQAVPAIQEGNWSTVVLDENISPWCTVA